MNEEIFEKIIAKKEFSKLPRKDVEIAFSHFEKRQVSEEEKIRLTRELLHKVFGAFGGKKLLNLKEKNFEWILKKHISTCERLGNFEKIYEKIFSDFINKKISVIDLGSGVNGFSYPYFRVLGLNVNYLGVESIGQFVELTNHFFEKEKIQGKIFHFSLFEKEKILNLIKKQKGKKIAFLFKVIDCLEMLEKDYSKELILEVSKFCERIVLSFSTESLIKRKKFKAKRTWILKFIKENFKILHDFEVRGERFIIFSK